MAAKKKTARQPGFVGDKLAKRVSARAVTKNKVAKSKKKNPRVGACADAIDTLIQGVIAVAEGTERNNVSRKDLNLLVNRATAARQRITTACGCRR